MFLFFQFLASSFFQIQVYKLVHVIFYLISITVGHLGRLSALADVFCYEEQLEDLGN